MGTYTILEAPTFTVENTQPFEVDFLLNANVSYKGFDDNVLILDFGDYTREGKTQTEILFKNKSGFNDIDIIAASGNCGCITPVFNKKEDGSFLVKVGVNLNRMAMGANEKFVKLTMKNGKVIRLMILVNGL